MAADVYAFACLTFEVLTGEVLFPGANHMAIMTSHFSHDGAPPLLGKLRRIQELEPLADALGSALRQDPRQRCSIAELRARLATFNLSHYPWPLG